MLSKSQAKLFFVSATLGFSGVFLWLTVDTIRQVPARSNEAEMTESVVRGKEIWEKNNCMGCHTILGEGAYYAPELTRSFERRGPDWLRLFLKDPQAMYPGQRKMVQYDFTEDEITDVIAFLEWIGKIDTNGFPRDPDMALTGMVATNEATDPEAADPEAAPVAAKDGDRPAMFDSMCIACHALGGAGGVVGPALDGVGKRYAEAELRTWLADPQKVKPGTAMPDLNLSEPDLDALTSFLMAQ